MATYKYKAISKAGKPVSGVVDAADEMAAIATIKETCTVVTKITESRTKVDGGLGSIEIGSKEIDYKVLAVMCSQFAIILKAGMPLALCIELIADQTEDKNLKAILQNVQEDVAGGTALSTSLDNRAKGKFPTTLMETIRAGEKSGTLEESFDNLTDYFERQYKIKAKMKNALTYPIFVMVIAVIVLIVVMIKVVPTLTQLFEDFGGQLPFYTQALIDLSNWFRNNIVLIVVVIIAIVVVYKIAYSTEDGKRLIDHLKLKIPVLGKIILLNTAANFANTFSALLKSGLTATNALAVTAKTLDNKAIETETADMVTDIEEGHMIGECMRKSQYYPKTLVEMTAIGEQTGELEQTLETIGIYYEGEAKTATDKAMAKLEPTLLCVIAAVAGYIVLAIYLPIFQLYGMM